MSEDLSRRNRSIIFWLMMIIALAVGFGLGYVPTHDRLVSARIELALCREKRERCEAERSELRAKQERIAGLISRLSDKKGRKTEIFKALMEVLK